MRLCFKENTRIKTHKIIVLSCFHSFLTINSENFLPIMFTFTSFFMTVNTLIIKWHSQVMIGWVMIAPIHYHLNEIILWRATLEQYCRKHEKKTKITTKATSRFTMVHYITSSFLQFWTSQWWLRRCIYSFISKLSMHSGAEFIIVWDAF